MEKFTKGEWYHVAERFGDFITSPDREGLVEICKIDTDYDGDIGVEQVANAHLIASAPDMYEDIESDITYLESIIDYVGDDIADGMRNIISDKRSLLAKARGEV